MARLIVNPGSPAAWEIQLKPGANSIGRGLANDFKITDGSVSNTHCQVLVSDGSAVIKDLGSSNGTFVNRMPVQEALLQHGQTVHLGGLEMMFCDETPVAQATVAPAASLPPSLQVAHLEAQTAPPVPVPTAARLRLSTAAPKTTADRKPNFGLGVLGALAGSFVGSLIYFLIFNYTGLRFKLIAIGVGYLAGLGAELLGRKEGSKQLGMIAAALALSGIVGAQYLVARNWWSEGEILLAQARDSAYADAVAEAKKVLAAVPNGADQEIRVYLAKEDADPGEKPDLTAVSDEDLKSFRETTMVEMRGLASGTIAKADFEKTHGLDQAKTSAEKESDEGTFKAVFLILFLSRLNLISLAAAAALAFKVCSNA
jgi:hypothetical protein